MARLVQMWVQQALERQPAPHYKIAYNFANSYSIKYNIVWQKVLNYSKPFPWKQVVADTEVPYYLKHANKYAQARTRTHACTDARLHAHAHVRTKA